MVSDKHMLWFFFHQFSFSRIQTIYSRFFVFHHSTKWIEISESFFTSLPLGNWTRRRGWEKRGRKGRLRSRGGLRSIWTRRSRCRLDVSLCLLRLRTESVKVPRFRTTKVSLNSLTGKTTSQKFWIEGSTYNDMRSVTLSRKRDENWWPMFIVDSTFTSYFIYFIYFSYLSGVRRI